MIKGNWGAIKLPLNFDANRLAEEIRQIPDSEWGGAGRTTPVFTDSQAIFLKGYAAATQNASTEDRDILKTLHYTRELIYSLIPADPQKCVLSYLPPNVNVGLHVDHGEYFDKTIRIHLPVKTNKMITMYFGACYRLKPGEVWALNNSATHGVENKHKTKPRIHLICDYLPSPQLVQLIEKSDRSLGKPCPHIHAKLDKMTRKQMKN